jgi:hypothetical protein
MWLVSTDSNTTSLFEVDLKLVFNTGQPHSVRRGIRTVLFTCEPFFYSGDDRSQLVIMASKQHPEKVRIVCVECPFSRVVTTEGDKSAEVIREHGQETGHKLTAEQFDDVE